MDLQLQHNLRELQHTATHRFGGEALEQRLVIDRHSCNTLNLQLQHTLPELQHSCNTPLQW